MSTKQRLFYTAASAIVVLLYLFLGGIMFTLIEGPHQESHLPLEVITLQKIVRNLDHMTATRNRTACNASNEEELNVIDETAELARELLHSKKGDILPWNIFTGFHFCMSAVTTIGYGFIVPVTPLGRGICIPYTLIGIPLNLFFSANVGFLVVRVLVIIKRGRQRLFRSIYKTWSNENGPEGANTLSYDVQTSDDPSHDTKSVCAHKQKSAAMSNSEDSSTTHVRLEARPGTDDGGINETLSYDTSEEDPDCPMWFVISTFAGLCFFFSYLMYLEEAQNWTYLEASYFVMMTLTTVGFGDLRPTVLRQDLHNTVIGWVKTFYYLAVMTFGMDMIAAMITVWSERVKDTAESAGGILQEHETRLRNHVKQGCEIRKLDRA